MSILKLNTTHLAHTLAIVTAAFYIVCWFLISVMPGFYVGMMRSWIHGIDISSLPANPLVFGTGLYGLITMTAVAWTTGYVFASVYNALGKK